MIKKFSSPKIKTWFEPMFFYGFFCGFERCGSATIPNFRGGNFPKKCVQTNSRILRKKEKSKSFGSWCPMSVSELRVSDPTRVPWVLLAYQTEPAQSGLNRHDRHYKKSLGCVS